MDWRPNWLLAVVRGHIRYYSVPMNTPALWIFRFQVGSGTARCRGAASTAASSGMVCGASSTAGCPCLLSAILILSAAWASLPKASAECGSSRSSGSVEGVVSNHDPYSDTGIESVS